MEKFLLLFISVSTLANGQQIDTSFCNPNELPAAPVQLAFNLFAFINQYQMTIEGNNGLKNETNELTEYYDGKRNIAVTSIQTGSVRFSIYNYDNTNEAMIVIGNKCVATPAIDPSNPLPVDVSQNIITPVLSLFQLDPSTKVVYIGKSIVRGIYVNQWQACIYDKSNGATSKLTYSLSDPTLWTPVVLASNVSSIPVEVTSESKLNGKLWKDTYSIVRFRAELLVDDDFWTTPPGVYCQSRQKTKSPPVMPPAFKLSGHVITGESGNPFREIFNYNERLIRRDYIDYTDMVFHSQIEDYNTGIEYKIDQTHGSCEMGLLDAGEIDSGVDGNVLFMKNYTVLFDFFTNDVQYVGQRKINDVKCDVWISAYADGAATIVYEWYFEVNKTAVKYQRPVSLKTYVYEDTNIDNTISYYFNDFDTSGLDISDFDLTTCSHLFNSKRFMFTILSENHRDLMVSHQRYLKYGISYEISKAANISPVRIVNIEVVFEKDKTFIAFSLLEKSNLQGPVTLANEASLEDAVSSLNKNISSNKFLIPLVVDSTSFISLEIDKSSFRELTKANSNTKTKSGYSGGTVAAISLIISVISIILGLVAGLFKEAILNKLNLASRNVRSVKNPTYSKEDL